MAAIVVAPTEAVAMGIKAHPPARLSPSGGDRGEAADDRAVRDVGEDGGDRGAATVVAHQEPGGSSSGALSAALSVLPMRGWTTGSRTFTSAVADDDAVEEPEQRPEQPAARVDRGEDRVVDEREHLPGHQVQQIPERLGARAIAR